MIEDNEFRLLSVEETNLLISRAQKGDEEAKEKLMLGNYPLIKSIVKRFSMKGVEYDDLYQLGSLGFLKAIAGFDSSFNVKFSTYAVPMIAGEIKRYLRDDGSIKISRAIKSLSIKICAFLENAKKNSNTTPSLGEIAVALGADEQDVIYAMDSMQSLISLYEKTDDKTPNSPNLIDKIVTDDKSDQIIDKIILKECIKSLPEREKKVIILRYFRGKTQTEIAEILGVSQVQVSRIEAKAIEKFKKTLK